MSRFRRPQFTAPTIPSPPKALAQIAAIGARVQGIVPIAAQVQSVGIASFAMNTALAQAKTQKSSLQQRLLKSELLQKIPVPSIPPALQGNVQDALAYARAMQALAANPRAALESKARASVDEFGQAVKPR